MRYYAIINGEKSGPFSYEELRRKCITPETPIWHDGMADWTPARNLPEISGVVTPEPSDSQYYSYGKNQQQVSNSLNSDNKEIPPIPEDYEGSNIFLMVFGFLCCGIAFIGAIFALISYINANEMKSLYSMGQYEMAMTKAASVQKMHKWAIWTDVILFLLYVIGIAVYLLFMGGLVMLSSQYQ